MRRAQTPLRAIGIDIGFSREGRAGSRIIRMRATLDKYRQLRQQSAWSVPSDPKQPPQRATVERPSSCSRQKIQLKGGRRLASGHVERLAAHVGLVPEQIVIAYMSAPVYVEFNRKAAELAMPASILASMLLNMIASNDLYKAVLGD